MNLQQVRICLETTKDVSWQICFTCNSVCKMVYKPSAGLEKTSAWAITAGRLFGGVGDMVIKYRCDAFIWLQHHCVHFNGIFSSHAGKWMQAEVVLVSYPRCWHCRSPAQGQCSLGLRCPKSHDSRSIRWLAEMWQGSRSLGLGLHTGKSKPERKMWINKRNVINLRQGQKRFTELAPLNFTFLMTMTRNKNMVVWALLLIWKL